MKTGSVRGDSAVVHKLGCPAQALGSLLVTSVPVCQFQGGMRQLHGTCWSKLPQSSPGLPRLGLRPWDPSGGHMSAEPQKAPLGGRGEKMELTSVCGPERQGLGTRLGEVLGRWGL